METLYFISILVPVFISVVALFFGDKKKLPKWVKPCLILLTILSGIFNLLFFISERNEQSSKESKDLNLKLDHQNQLLNKLYENSLPLENIYLKISLELDSSSAITKKYFSFLQSLYKSKVKSNLYVDWAYNNDKTFLDGHCDEYPEVCGLLNGSFFKTIIRANDSSFLNLHTGQVRQLKDAEFHHEIEWSKKRITLTLLDRNPRITEASTSFSSFLNMYNASIRIEPNIPHNASKPVPVFFNIREVMIFNLKGHSVVAKGFSRQTRDSIFTSFTSRFSSNIPYTNEAQK